MHQKMKYHSFLKPALFIAVGTGLCLFGNYAFAQQGLAGAAKGVSDALKAISTLLGGIAYVAGIVMAIIGIMKFKAYKQDPKIGIATPIVIVFVAVGLLFLPTLIKMSAETLGIKGSAVQTGQEITF